MSRRKNYWKIKSARVPFPVPILDPGYRFDLPIDLAFESSFWSRRSIERDQLRETLAVDLDDESERGQL